MFHKNTSILIFMMLAYVVLMLATETEGIPLATTTHAEYKLKDEKVKNLKNGTVVSQELEGRNKDKAKERNRRFLWWGSEQGNWGSPGGFRGGPGDWGQNLGWGTNYGGGISRPWANSWTWPGNRNRWWGSSWWPSSWWNSQSYSGIG